MSDQFPRAHRLCHSTDFTRVFKARVKLSNQAFTVFYTPNDLEFARVGLAISKKTIPKSAFRTMLKRLIRESFRQEKGLPNLDIVVSVKDKCKDLPKTKCRLALEELWKQLKMF